MGKWVKSLRLATKGAFLWDVLLNLQVTMTTTASPHSHEQTNDYSRQATDESSSSSLYPHHSLSAKRSMHKKRSSKSLSAHHHHHHHVIHQHKGSDLGGMHSSH